LSETARRNFPKATGGSPLAGAAFAAQPRKPKKVVGIQIGAVFFVDEGVEPVLDLLQNKLHVNTRFVAAFAYGRGITRRKIPGQSLPNHGKQKCDTDTFLGRRYAAAHSQYFSNTLWKHFRAPDLGAFGVFESVLPASRKRGVQNAIPGSRTLFAAIFPEYRGWKRRAATTAMQSRSASTIPAITLLCSI
jgi:hypothetical protein